MCVRVCARAVGVRDAPQETDALRETLAQLRRDHAYLIEETVAKDAEIVQHQGRNQALQARLDALPATADSPGTAPPADSPPSEPDLGAGDGEHPQVTDVAARASLCAQPPRSCRGSVWPAAGAPCRVGHDSRRPRS